MTAELIRRLELGGRLLAKALTGERVEADMLEEILQIHTVANEDSSV